MTFAKTSFLTSTLNQFEPNAIAGQELDWGTDVKKITCVIDSSETGTLYPSDVVSIVTTSTTLQPKVAKAAASGTAFGVIVYDPRKTSYKAGDKVTVLRNGGVLSLPVVTTCNAGAAIYFDPTDGSFTTTASTNPKVGIAVQYIGSAVSDGKLVGVEVQQQNA